MKYVYTGAYREFRGYVFVGGKPVTITDGGTLKAIEREPDFKAVVESPIGAPEAIRRYPEFQKVVDSPPDACPKCGKVVRQGRYMHVKFCRGGK